MTAPVVALLEAFAPAMQDEVRALVGPDLDLRFPASNSEPDRAAILPGADYAVVRAVKMPESLLDAAPRLKVLYQWGTGTDGLPVDAAKARGITVARSPGVNAPSVADLAIGLMLACLRRIPFADARIRAGNWAEPDRYQVCRDLTGATVGLLGYGAIGAQVARRLSGFDCTVRYTRASGPLPDVPGFLPFDDLLTSVDVLSLHLPLTSATRGMLGSAELARMKPGAVLVNLARGGIVDEGALAELLRAGRIAAAGLDAFETEPLPMDSPLLSAPNVVLSAHSGGGTRDNLARLVRHWSGNLRAHAAGAAIDPTCLV